METQVEELPENKVRLSVQVPGADVKHAVEHAASDLAGSIKIPGFRKGRVPLPVLVQRVGKERIYAEAVESHIGGWYRSAVASSRIRPVERPHYEYELPSASDSAFSFTATVAVQPKLELPDWTKLEVPAPEAEVPAELVDQELEDLRQAAADLAPAARPIVEGDVVVVDLVGPEGAAQRDYIVEVGDPRFIEQVNDALVGMTAGGTKTVEWDNEEGQGRFEVTVKEVKEKVLPPLDDELARAASEFDTLAELRADVEARFREQLEEEIEAAFRTSAADALVEASDVRLSGPLVAERAAELLDGLRRSLERRGISAQTYLAVTNQTPEQLQERLHAEAALGVARELVLEAAADRLGLEVSDEELREFVREQAREAGEEDPAAVADRIWESGRHEQLREDLRLRRALDRIVSEVKRIPVELARAREQLWTPEKEKPAETKIWTPGQ